MQDYEEDRQPAGVSQARLIASLLEAGGVALFLATAIWTVTQFWRIGQSAGEFSALSTQPAGNPSAAAALDPLTAVAGLVLGFCGGLMLLGLAQVVRRLDALPGALSGSRREPDFSPPGPVRPYFDETKLDAMVSMLRELRDISLLNDSQRAKRLETQGQALATDLEREVPALLREHRWREARRRIRDARERFPTSAQFEALERQIETMRAQVEAHDIDSAERQVNDLAALQAWERAADVVRELLARHPDSAKANALALRVRQQYDKTQAEQRARLMAQAQEAVRARNWQAALQTANTIIQRYPRSPEAEALRLQVPTLEENVEIQARQRTEARIRELVKQGRFDVALQMSHELIDRYPNSPQAEVLRKQLDKLHQRVRAMGPT